MGISKIYSIGGWIFEMKRVFILTTLLMFAVLSFFCNSGKKDNNSLWSLLLFSPLISLSAPTGLTAVQTGDGQVTVSWGAVSGATSYNIYWSATSGVTTVNGTIISGITAASYIQNGLPPGMKYYIVTAVNSNRESSTSSQVSSEVNAYAWHRLNTVMNSNGYVYALTVDSSDNLYAGGAFTTAGGTTVNYIAKWDGATWSALNTGTNDVVNALAFDSTGNLYAGGKFSFFVTGGNLANYIARWGY